MTTRTHRAWSPDPDDMQIRIKSAYELLRKGLRNRRALKLHDKTRRRRFVEECIDAAGLRRTSLEQHFRLRAECVLQGKERFCHTLKCRDPGECRHCPIVLRHSKQLLQPIISGSPGYAVFSCSKTGCFISAMGVLAPIAIFLQLSYPKSHSLPSHSTGDLNTNIRSNQMSAVISSAINAGFRAQYQRKKVRGIPDYACTNKVRYGTWSAARRSARALRRRTGDIAFPYHCHSCGAFHLGSWAKRALNRFRVSPPSRERLQDGMRRLYRLLLSSPSYGAASLAACDNACNCTRTEAPHDNRNY